MRFSWPFSIVLIGRTFYHIRACPGRWFGDGNIWLIIASTLATFNVEKARDGNGEVITPPAAFAGSFVRLVINTPGSRLAYVLTTILQASKAVSMRYQASIPEGCGTRSRHQCEFGRMIRRYFVIYPLQFFQVFIFVTFLPVPAFLRSYSQPFPFLPLYS